jgi:hypothetical protein
MRKGETSKSKHVERVVGCVVAQPIQKAMKLVRSEGEDEGIGGDLLDDRRKRLQEMVVVDPGVGSDVGNQASVIC